MSRTIQDLEYGKLEFHFSLGIQVSTLNGNVSLYLPLSEPIVFNLALSPVIDGDFIPDDPSKLFNNAADIDYIAGVNNMDGHAFTSIDVPGVNIDLLPVPV